MKKYITIFCAVIGQIIYSQVGIGTQNPSATLDVVSLGSTNETYGLKVNDRDSNTMMSIADNGNLYFKRSLIAGASAGVAGYVLGSEGSNNTPVWKEVLNSPLYRYVAIAYHVRNSNKINGLPANSNVIIDFGNSAVINSAVIGSWNETTKKYRLLESGIYDITASVTGQSSLASANRKAVMMIHLGGYSQVYKGTNSQGSSSDFMTTGKVSRYLTAGTEISVTVRVSNLSGSGTTWSQNNAILNINYSPKTN
ncbi:MAG TPA: hypothetical protein VL022_06890 [Moheibacter sp.]|nr:hypothetical protein [Moheibacter sp.]